MAKAKYTRGKDGYFRTKAWDGTYNPNGTKHRVSLFSSKSSRDLENQVIELNNKVRNRQFVQKDDVSVQDYAKQWLDTYKSVRERNTYLMYRNIVYVHFTMFAPIRLQDFNHNHLQMLINSTLAQPRTCQQIMLTIKQVIRIAIKDKRLPAGSLEEICDDIDLPRYIPAERRPLSQTEIEAIKVADFTDRERCFVYLIYGCGLRREEALALTPFDISLKKEELTVNKALCFDGNNSYIKGTKSKSGTRTIPMPKFLTDFLKIYLPAVQGRLVGKADGSDITHSSYRRMWDSIVRKMNLAAGGTDELRVIYGLTAHMFRHNYCTQLCYQIPKISTKKIAQLLGDSEKMVIEVYNHILEEKEQTEDAIAAAVSL